MKHDSKVKFIHLFFLWLIIVVLWTLYRLNFAAAEWVEEIIIKPIIFILPAILYLVSRRQKINQPNLGLHIESWEKVISWGVIVGILLSLELTAISLLKGEMINPQLFTPKFYIASLVIAGATAFWEELLYRGFFLNYLQKIFTNLNTSNIISAVGFSLGHLPIAIAIFHYQNLELVVYLTLVLILGLINGFVFQKTGNIFASVIAHTMWNFTVGFFI